MKTRRLGENGIEVGEMGLGCWQLGGDWGELPNDERSFAILSAAVESGVTLFDTADVYGSGRSEVLIGRWMREHEAPVTVATKFGRGGDVFPDRYSEEALRRGVDASRVRLGVDALDLLQLHCIPTGVLREGAVFDWLRRLKDAGAIRQFGASVETVEEGLICIEQEGMQSLQIIFNIFRQKPAEELLPRAAAAGVGILVRLPLASGLLTGKFSAATQFATSDHRNYNREGRAFNVGETFAGLPFEKGVELAEALRGLVPAGMSMVELALGWILDHDAVSVVIPGASSPKQAAANAAAAERTPLPAEVHQALAAFYAERVFDHIRGPY